MIKLATALCALLFTTTSFANLQWNWSDIVNVKAIQATTMEEAQDENALGWKVGESTDHNVNMGFIKGTSHTVVREETQQGFWLDQDMDMGFMGKQKVEIHIDKYTGQIIEIRANGEPQDIPEAGEQEIVEAKEANITVPAGTFDCIYLKVLNKKDNKHSEAWMNRDIVPIMGSIKQIAPGPMGNVTMELTGFHDL